MEIYLVRHGESEANAGLTTELDSGLTLRGRQQAELTARRLQTEAITQIFVSPLLRTLQTVQPICAAVQLKSALFPLACEYFSPKYPGFATFAGMSPMQIIDRFDFVDRNQAVSCNDRWWPQDFENYRTSYARAEQARDLLIEQYYDSRDHILIVSHADPIGRFIEAFLRSGPHPDGPPWSDNCAITHLTLAVRYEPAAIIALNDSTHYQGLLDAA